MEPTLFTKRTDEAQTTEQPAVLLSVFKSIFVETPKDFFGGIKNFFLRYARHFFYCFTYIFQPTLRNRRLSKLDWKENCQQSFEWALIASVFIIFLIKMNWIPVSDKDLQQTYGNDLAGMLMELMIFIIFGIAYCVLCVFSILAGRLLRAVFSIPVSRREGDILFTYLNNTIFTFSVALAFFFRLGTTGETLEAQGVTASGMWLTFVFLFFILLLIWSIRFVQLNLVSTIKKIIFLLLIPVLFSMLYGFAGFQISSFLLGT